MRGGARRSPVFLGWLGLPVQTLSPLRLRSRPQVTNCTGIETRAARRTQLLETLGRTAPRWASAGPRRPHTPQKWPRALASPVARFTGQGCTLGWGCCLSPWLSTMSYRTKWTWALGQSPSDDLCLERESDAEKGGTLGLQDKKAKSLFPEASEAQEVIWHRWEWWPHCTWLIMRLAHWKWTETWSVNLFSIFIFPNIPMLCLCLAFENHDAVVINEISFMAKYVPIWKD